jgi:hypothetical protein
VGVGDEVALIAGEYVVDGVARVVARELEQHVPAGSDQHPEVTGAASLLLLHEHAGGVDAQVLTPTLVDRSEAGFAHAL